MNIRDVEKTTVVDIAGSTISKADMKSIEKIFEEKASYHRVGINMKEVTHIDSSFVDFLCNSYDKNKLSLFGLNNDIFLMLFITKAEKYANIYLDENDFCQAKNSIVHRRLKLLKSA